MSDIVERLRNTAVFIANATGKENSQWVNDAADDIDRLRKALEQIKVVCEDNRRAKDIGPSEEMTLYFIQQISEQALRAAVSAPSKP